MLNFLAAVSGNGAGGGGSFESIATATGTGSSATITFSSIPSTYQHLHLRIMTRSGDASIADNFYIRFNGSSTGYALHNLTGDGASATANGTASTTEINIGLTFGANAATNLMGVSLIDIHDYASTTKNKTLRAFGGRDNNSTNGTVRLSSGLWNNTNAITSISIIAGVGPWTTTSTFALYGIKGA